MDMDGVLVREEHAIPGADRFLERLRERGRPFMLLTNNSIYTPRDLAARLRASGLDVPEAAIWTSALATARFLEDQRPGGSAFVIGEAGVTTALHEAGYTLTEREPDYVVLGETRTYSFERITRAIRLIAAGARFIATNPDPSGPERRGPAARDRLGRGADQPRDRRRALLRRQAEPADDALGAERDRRALRDDGDDRRPDGHRRRRRPRGRAADGARAHRRDHARGGRALPLPRRRGSSSRSPSSSTSWGSPHHRPPGYPSCRGRRRSGDSRMAAVAASHRPRGGLAAGSAAAVVLVLLATRHGAAARPRARADEPGRLARRVDLRARRRARVPGDGRVRRADRARRDRDRARRRRRRRGRGQPAADPARGVGWPRRSATSPPTCSAAGSAGASCIAHGPRVGVTPPRLARVDGFFARHGGKAILIGRFIGLVRAVAPFLAGASGLPLRTFLPYSLLGTARVGVRVHARRLRVPRVLRAPPPARSRTPRSGWRCSPRPRSPSKALRDRRSRAPSSAGPRPASAGWSAAASASSRPPCP